MTDQDSLFCHCSPTCPPGLPIVLLYSKCCYFGSTYRYSAVFPYQLSLVSHSHRLRWLRVRKSQTAVSDCVCIKTACGQQKASGKFRRKNLIKLSGYSERSHTCTNTQYSHACTNKITHVPYLLCELHEGNNAKTPDFPLFHIIWILILYCMFNTNEK